MKTLSEQATNNMQIYSLEPEQALVSLMNRLNLSSIARQTNQNQMHLLSASSIRAIFAEVLRVVLWSLCNEGLYPIYTTRLLHSAQNTTLLVLNLLKNASVNVISDDFLQMRGDAPMIGSSTSEDEVTRLLYNTLNDLEVLGDVVSLPHGYWLPSPVRLVPLSFLHRWVLVGGRPSHKFPEDMQAGLEHEEIARFLTQDPRYFNLQSVLQSEAEWCRFPHDKVDIWADHILSETILQPLENLNIPVAFYAPSIRNASSMQYFRWTNDINALANGRYLMRSSTKTRLSYYSIAEIIRGKVVATCAIDLHYRDLRRLLYGIDMLTKCSTTIRVTHTGGMWSFSLQNELPHAEYRLFTALGHLHLPSDGHYYPHTWEVSDIYGSKAADALVRLGIRLEGAGKLLSSLED